MVKIVPVCLDKRPIALQNKNSSRFVKFQILPILLVATILTANSVNAQQSPTPVTKPAPAVGEPLPPPPLKGLIAYGYQINLNGRNLPGAWLQRPGQGRNVKTLLSDGALRQFFGADLLNSSIASRQPLQWFLAVTRPAVLTTLLASGYRYLDISELAQTAGWQMVVSGNTLFINTPQTKIAQINQEKLLQGERVVIDLDRPTPWQVAQELPVKRVQDPDTPTSNTALPNRDWTIALDGIADPALLQRYAPQPIPVTPSFPNLTKQLPSPVVPTLPSVTPPSPPPEPLIKQIEVINNQTFVRLSVPFGYAPRITTLPDPNRLVIDIRPDALVSRDIVWASGVRWRQQYINLGAERFPVVWLEINPRTSGLRIRPILPSPDTVVGTAPLIQIAPQNFAIAGINGGYFNRNNRLPLGAIRRDNQWISSPILNRGAIAWNDSGQFYFGRLALQENLVAANNLRLPILFLNSGFVQQGIARYTPTWGAAYTPLTDNEIVLVVQRKQVVNQFAPGKAGETAIPIPRDGYLLTLRGNAGSNATALPIGTQIEIENTTTPSEFNRFPNVIGAGPLLVQNRQVVLDGKAEKFGDAFIAEKAIRSAICTTNNNNLIIAAVHNRAGGAGPTLAEHAQLMQQMGCIDALNLDGGSSTSLYLSGQLLDRSPRTAARVHNGIGIFLKF